MTVSESDSKTLPRRSVSIPVRAAEPHVEVIRDGNTVNAIRVTCACGFVVDIECDYAPAGDSSEEANNGQ